VVHEQAAGFALDALDPDEAAEFERHLAICPACEDELAGLRVAAAALAFAVESAVPRSGLRGRVVANGAPVIPLPRRKRPQLVAAVAVLAACVAIAVARPWGDGGSLGGVRQYTAEGARATLLVDRAGSAVLSVRHLPPPPAGKAYEVWVVARGRAVSAGRLRGPSTALTRPVPTGASVAVSIEPRSGSLRPTGPMLLRMETT